MSNITVVTVDGSPVLNPFPWSAFLPPQTASEIEIVRYILVGVAGAFIWDILNNIRKDYLFAAGHTRWRFSTFIYFLSKLSTLVFVISSAMFTTAPISNCFHTGKAVSVLLCLAVPLTCLLFFFRACAVFGMKPLAAAIYGVLWLGVLGGCLTTIPGSSDANIGPTPYCAYETFRLYSAAATITPLINDGIVFFAISWRLWSNTWTRRTVKNGVRVLVFGDYLPAFSRLLLQDGQIYFLTTVGANLLVVVMAFSTSVPNPYRAVFSVPNVALANIMACRVYRRTVLRGSRQQQSSSDSSPTARENPTTDNLTVNLITTVETMA